ncbi:BARH1 protein, partial [Aegithalos caudatus]|nr:BARH1 protein [Aegithalos caudatus]
RECLEAAVPRPGLDAHLQPGQVSAPSQSRTVTSSFLISTNGPHGGQEPAGRIPTKPGEDFREKMEKNTSSSSSDSEYKGKSGSTRWAVQGGPGG